MAESATADVLIGTVKKNSTEEVRVAQTEFNGIPLVDCRVWTVPAVPGSESKPTKKGLTLRPATWAELLPYIAQALDGDAPAEVPEPMADSGADDLTEDPFGDQ